jgi:hypothetical protein
MPIYEMTAEKLVELSPTTFNLEKVYERDDLQRYLRNDIAPLSSDLKVIAEEFSDWEDSSRRIDLLCIDRSGSLVVVELKRTTDGGHMELQALRYAAMVSLMSFSKVVETYKSFKKIELAQARAELLGFLEIDDLDDPEIKRVRIILVASDFSREVTTSVLWLNTQNLGIQCVTVKPYKLPEGRILLDIRQIIPLPEAYEYQTRLREKEKADEEAEIERYELRRRFWEGLLEIDKQRKALHTNRKAGTASRLGTAIRSGFNLNYIIKQRQWQVELYIDLRGREENLRCFRELHNQKQKVEEVFGAPLEWEESENRRCCIYFESKGSGYRSDESEWPAIQSNMVNTMMRLYEAFSGPVTELSI